MCNLACDFTKEMQAPADVECYEITWDIIVKAIAHFINRNTNLL
jgi:hypothetical protein